MRTGEINTLNERGGNSDQVAGSGNTRFSHVSLTIHHQNNCPTSVTHCPTLESTGVNDVQT